MQSKVTPHTIPELTSNFEAALKWVHSVGFPVERGRLADYRRILKKLNDEFDVHGWGGGEGQAHMKDLCTVLLEVREIVSIYRGLSIDSQPDGLDEIRHYVKGPFRSVDESPRNSSNRPRNVGFELYLTALCAYAGLKPIYETDADLSFRHGGYTYFIEAKRPMYSHSMHAVIKDANKQLTRRLSGGKDGQARGLIALDLSKVINPHDKVMPVLDTAHLDRLMNAEAANRIEELNSEWHKNRAAGTVGVLLCFKLLTQFAPKRDLNTLRWISFVQFGSHPGLTELGSTLQSAIRHVC